MRNLKKYCKGIVSTTLFCGNTCLMFPSFASGLWIKWFSKKAGIAVRNYWFRKWLQFSSWDTKAIAGVKLKVHGFENIPKGSSFIIISDHKGWGDIWCVCDEFLDWNPRFSAKAAIFNVPFMGWGMRIMSNIPIKRGDKNPSQNWIVTIAEAFSGKSKLLDGAVRRISRISIEDFRNRIVSSRTVKAQQRDMEAIQNALKDLDEEKLPFAIVVFAPGTRWTVEKMRKAKERFRFKHSLPPKAGAVTQLLKFLHNKLDGIVLFNVGYVHNGSQRQQDDRVKLFTSFACGDIEEVHTYAEWIPIEKVPVPGKWDRRSEEYYQEVKKWLFEIWGRIDERMERWIETGVFENPYMTAQKCVQPEHQTKPVI